jgi:hypothetical protein
MPLNNQIGRYIGGLVVGGTYIIHIPNREAPRFSQLPIKTAPFVVSLLLSHPHIPPPNGKDKRISQTVCYCYGVGYNLARLGRR